MANLRKPELLSSFYSNERFAPQRAQLRSLNYKSVPPQKYYSGISQLSAYMYRAERGSSSVALDLSRIQCVNRPLRADYRIIGKLVAT